jgi:predicted transcriptional regulator
MTSAVTNSIRERALDLLGDNIDPKVAAAALGISQSMISQYLSEDDFAQEVAARRYKALIGNNSRDRKYDALEDKILDRLEKSLSMIFDPMKLVAVLSKINGAVRRGANAPATMTDQKPSVVLNMPTFVLQKFTVQTNINNQVVAVQGPDGSSQSLVTIQSKALSDLATQVAKPLQVERNVSDAIPIVKTPAGVVQNAPG